MTCEELEQAYNAAVEALDLAAAQMAWDAWNGANCPGVKPPRPEEGDGTQWSGGHDHLPPGG